MTILDPLFLQIIRGTAHEMRNALTAITGFSDLLQSRITGEIEHQMLDKIQEGGARIQHISEVLVRFMAGDSPLDTSLQDAWTVATWQHRGSLATVCWDNQLETSVSTTSAYNFIFFDMACSILLDAAHASPIVVSLAKIPDGISVNVTWASLSGMSIVMAQIDTIRQVSTPGRLELIGVWV